MHNFCKLKLVDNLSSSSNAEQVNGTVLIHVQDLYQNRAEILKQDLLACYHEENISSEHNLQIYHGHENHQVSD